MATGWKHISPLLQRLKTLSSPIPVLGDNVKVLYSPQQFFTALKVYSVLLVVHTHCTVTSPTTLRAFCKLTLIQIFFAHSTIYFPLFRLVTDPTIP